MYLSHKIRINPNKTQISYLNRACGIKRFAYNWALGESKRLYEQGIKTSGYDLSKRLNAVKKEQFPFMLTVSKWVVQKAIYDVFDAYKNWWRKTARAPRFKKRGRCRESFYIGLNSIRVNDNHLVIPLLTPIRMAQQVRFPGRIMSATISKSSGRWYASVQVEVDEFQWSYAHACETQAVCGVDLGVVDLAVIDDGSRFTAPRGLRIHARKLRRLQKSVSRRKKDSNRKRKAVFALGREFERVTNIRKNTTHEITSFLVENYRYIGVETLNLKGMLKNHRLAKSISDAALGEVIRQLEYKTVLAGSILVKADKFFPSSKTCSSCGAELGSLPLSIRKWTCPLCDSEHDRDINAAINLKQVAVRYRETENARGVESADVQDQLNVKLSAVKRESGNRKPEKVTV